MKIFKVLLAIALAIIGFKIAELTGAIIGLIVGFAIGVAFLPKSK